MSDDQFQSPDSGIESLKERLREVVDKADEPEDLDLEEISNITKRVQPSEKRREPAWSDLENLVDRILAKDGQATEVDATEIYGFTDKILGES